MAQNDPVRPQVFGPQAVGGPPIGGPPRSNLALESDPVKAAGPRAAVPADLLLTAYLLPHSSPVLRSSGVSVDIITVIYESIIVTGELRMRQNGRDQIVGRLWKEFTIDVLNACGLRRHPSATPLWICVDALFVTPISKRRRGSLGL